MPQDREPHTAADHGLAGSTTSAMLRPPVERLGDYRLIRRVGRGGMGQVFEARHLRLDRAVAIKTLGNLGTKDGASRFEREMRALGSLPVHPNVIHATDAGVFEGIPYLVMELIDGVNLSRLCEAKGPLSVSDACELMRQAAAGLQFIADNQMVHRDFKPSNLLLTKDGNVKLLDLGLACWGDRAGSEGERTQTGQSLGTPDYMAPEQWRDSRTVDVRADIYSLGCTLYFLLASRPPFGGEDYDSSAKKMYGHLEEQPPAIEELRDGLPDELINILNRLLSKDPDDRYQTPREVMEAIRPFARGHQLRQLLPDAEDSGDFDLDTPSESESQAAATLATSEKDSPQQPPGKRSNTSLTPFAIGAACLITLAAFGYSIRKQSTDVQRSDDSATQADVSASQSAAASNEPTRNQLVDSGGAGGLTDTVSSTANGQDTVKFRFVRLSHYRSEDREDAVEDLGRLGVSKQLDVRMDDDLLMQIELDEPAYVYVLALNPDGSRQLCYPSLQNSPPIAQVELKVPENADEFFGLTDGAGPQAFVVLAAKQPLPSYEEFQKRIARLPWEPFDLASPWCFNGRHFFPSVEPPKERGSIRRLAPEEISTTVTYLQEHANVDSIYAVFFPVMPLAK